MQIYMHIKFLCLSSMEQNWIACGEIRIMGLGIFPPPHTDFDITRQIFDYKSVLNLKHCNLKEARDMKGGCNCFIKELHTE